jgi:hypothetical protein
VKHVIALLFIFVVACGPVNQPESNRTVAAFEVTLRTQDDYRQFLAILNDAAQREGFHLDHRDGGGVEPSTINASIWRGDDEESMAHAMDFEDRIGRVWITFPLGESPVLTENFRRALMAQIKAVWPSTVTLPIMPNGAIPLTHDLVRTQDGYQVRESAAQRYDERAP